MTDGTGDSDDCEGGGGFTEGHADRGRGGAGERAERRGNAMEGERGVSGEKGGMGFNGEAHGGVHCRTAAGGGGEEERVWGLEKESGGSVRAFERKNGIWFYLNCVRKFKPIH